MGAFNNTFLADRVLASVAALGTKGAVHVLVTEIRELGYREATQVERRRILLQRLVAGSHKQLAREVTVLVGYDLDLGETPTRLATPASSSASYRVEVLEGSPHPGLELPFEGVFNLRSVEIAKPR